MKTDESNVPDTERNENGPNEFLAVDDGVSLQHLEVELLVRRMLVHDEQIISTLHNNETKIELKQTIYNDLLILKQSSSFIKK